MEILNGLASVAGVFLFIYLLCLPFIGFGQLCIAISQFTIKDQFAPEMSTDLKNYFAMAFSNLTLMFLPMFFPHLISNAVSNFQIFGIELPLIYFCFICGVFPTLIMIYHIKLCKVHKRVDMV